jgi:threonine aldolase
MRDAISRAEVGDDVFGEDPTVQALEAEAARLTGKEAALFVTSGTMSNQLAIALQTRPGDEVIVGEGAHVYVFESGAGAALSGVQFAIAGTGGLFDVAAMEERINPRAHWSARTSLVCVENTHNRAGGRIFPQADAAAIATAAKSRGFAVHLDGARIWNVSVALGIDVKDLCAPFDTISVCFSKGLGAPAGSALCASRAIVDQARFLRKRWGGGMRQSGILAAGALFALEHNRERLREDHYKAKKFAEKVAGVPGASIDVAKVETNIVNVDLEKAGDVVAKAAAAEGLLINASGPKRLRAVMHLDVTPEDAEKAVDLLAAAITKA